MPLKIVETPEPLSENSLSQFEVRKPLLIGSDAARVLESELRDYCRGDIAGRSFLIAGHRGSGKSTLVANAFLEVWTQFQAGKIKRRPLFVPLSGPALFLRTPANTAEPSGTEDEVDEANESPAEPNADDAEGSGELADAAKPKPRAGKTEAQIVLEQIVLGLHRAVTREFSRSYWERSIANTDRPGEAKPDTRELAAQFDAELMDCPEPGRLSEFYRLAQLHPEGLVPGARTGSAAELLALSGISDAYKRISGDYAREDKRTDQQTREGETGFGGDNGSMKEIVAAALPLLAGSAAGVSVGAAAGPNLPGVLAAIVAALGAVLVVKASTKRTMTRSRVENFIFDLSLATLDRILPVLIERLWRAGFAPMFVVDELDKVDDLPKRMRDVVHHLKKLVAESAFFCFLADRQYFEDMLDQTSNRAYPQEYTYYSHRLFVAFQARDFAAYLEQKLQIDPAPGAASPPAPSDTANLTTPAAAPQVNTRPTGTTAAAAAAAAFATTAAAAPASAVQSNAYVQMTLDRGQLEKEDALVRDFLMWVLRHRSQLHPLDLRRALRGLSDEDSNVTVSASGVLRNAYLIDVTIQVLIEALLDSTDVAQKISNNYESLRLIHDALYFITREWLRGRPTLEISDKGKKVFIDYLEARTGRTHTANGNDEHGDDAEQKETTAAKKTKTKKKSKKRATTAKESTETGSLTRDGSSNGTSLNPFETEFLFNLVRELANALSDENAAKTLIDEWQNPARNPKTLLAGSVRKEMLLDSSTCVLQVKERQVGSDGATTTVIYKWRYDPSGSARDPATSAAPSAAAQAGAPADSATPAPPAPDAATTGAAAKAAVPAPPPAEPAEPAPTAPAPSPPDWRRHWLNIQTFADTLNVAIGLTVKTQKAQQPQPLGYSALARQFGLIAASPPWEEVEEAHKRLERGGQNATSIASDTNQIVNFWNMLQQRQDVIVRALACAAAIGVASRETLPGARVVRGLTILARSLRLTERSPDEVAAALRTVEAALTNLFEVLRDGHDAAMPPASGSSIATALPAFIGKVKDVLLVDEKSWEPLLTLAWNGALTRQLALYSGRGLQDPSVPELLYACRETGPSAVLDVDPRQTTAAKWTAALVAAVESPQKAQDIALGEVPSWVGLTAMRELGFKFADPVGLELAMKVLTGGVKLEAHALLLEVFTQLLVTRAAVDAAIIVVRQPSSSLGASWPPSPTRFMSLVATAGQVELLLSRQFPLGHLVGATRRLLAVEMNDNPDVPPSKEQEASLEKIRAGLAALRFRPVHVYDREPSDKKLLKYPYVIAPRYFDNLVTADERQSR